MSLLWTHHASTIDPHVPGLSRGARRLVRTVLLVEDEPMLRELTEEMLAELSFTVISAGSAEDALRLCREHGAGIDLVITDLMLPAMDGRQLADRVRQMIPGLPVILTSGYGAQATVARDKAVALLQKPYTHEALEASIREVLEG